MEFCLDIIVNVGCPASGILATPAGMQRIQVGGTKGGIARREQMGTDGYKEMGHSGGEARKEQMAEEHGGDVSAGYAEMGREGGSK